MSLLLPGLPNELGGLVLEHVFLQSPATLFTLLNVSKAWNHHTKSILYKDITLKIFTEFIPEEDSSSSSSSSSSSEDIDSYEEEEDEEEPMEEYARLAPNELYQPRTTTAVDAEGNRIHTTVEEEENVVVPFEGSRVDRFLKQVISSPTTTTNSNTDSTGDGENILSFVQKLSIDSDSQKPLIDSIGIDWLELILKRAVSLRQLNLGGLQFSYSQLQFLSLSSTSPSLSCLTLSIPRLTPSSGGSLNKVLSNLFSNHPQLKWLELDLDNDRRSFQIEAMMDAIGTSLPGLQRFIISFDSVDFTKLFSECIPKLVASCPRLEMVYLASFYPEFRDSSTLQQKCKSLILDTVFPSHTILHEGVFRNRLDDGDNGRASAAAATENTVLFHAEGKSTSTASFTPVSTRLTHVGLQEKYFRVSVYALSQELYKKKLALDYAMDHPARNVLAEHGFDVTGREGVLINQAVLQSIIMASREASRASSLSTGEGEQGGDGEEEEEEEEGGGGAASTLNDHVLANVTLSDLFRPVVRGTCISTTSNNNNNKNNNNNNNSRSLRKNKESSGDDDLDVISLTAFVKSDVAGYNTTAFKTLVNVFNGRLGDLQIPYIEDELVPSSMLLW